MMKLSHDKLPSSWMWTQLKHVSDIKMGQSPPGPSYNNNGIGTPFYQGKINFGDLHPSPAKWCSSPAIIAHDNDVLICVRAPVGPTNLANQDCCIGRGLAALSPLDNINSLFILYYLRTIEKKISRMGSGSTFNAIRRADLESILIPLAPIGEQKRIVQKITELNNENKEVRILLGNLQTTMKKFRRSVLLAAFSGKLIEGNNNDESARLFLKRIRIKEQKIVKDHNIEINTSDVEKLQILSKGWTWTTIGEIFDVVMGQSPPGASYNNEGRGIPLLNGPTEFGTDHPSPLQWTTRPTRISEKDDLLICVRGSTTGKMNWSDQRYCIGRGLAAIRPLSHELDIRLLSYFLRIKVADLMERSGGSTFPNLRAEKLRGFLFPLPPLSEQAKIVEKIKILFSFADEI